MKTILLLIFLFQFPIFTNSQDTSFSVGQSGLLTSEKTLDSIKQNKGYPMPGFAISFNLMGFIQHGPSINAEVGLTRNMVFNVHIRFLSLGLFSTRVSSHDGFSDVIGQFAFGGGPVYFFGHKQSKPYLGLIIDCSIAENINDGGQNYAGRSRTITTFYTINAGYRFRFNNGFFISGGCFAGISNTRWEWNFTGTQLNATGNTEKNISSGQETRPFFTAEFTLGYEF